MLVLGETVAGQSDRQLTGSSKIAAEVVRTVMQSEAQGGRARGSKLVDTSSLHILRTMVYMVFWALTGRDHTVLIQSCCRRANSVVSEQLRPDNSLHTTSPSLSAQTSPTVRVGSENC